MNIQIQKMLCRGLLPAAGIFLAMTMASAAALAAAGPFHVEHTWQIDGEGGWHYLAVDSQNGLLYITRGNHVQVIDRKNGRQVVD